MSADQLIVYMAWSFYILVFIGTALTAARRPTRTNLDIALMFGLTTAIIAIAVAQRLALLPLQPVVSLISGASLLALPYMLLRLIDDFSHVPAWFMRSAEALL